MTIFNISHFSIPNENSQLKRVVPPRVSVLHENFWGGYDTSTLFYDVYFDSDINK